MNALQYLYMIKLAKQAEVKRGLSYHGSKLTTQKASTDSLIGRDPRTEKFAPRGPRDPVRGPDADQRNFGKSGPRRTTDQENFQSADRGGPRTSEIKNCGPFLLNIKGK